MMTETTRLFVLTRGAWVEGARIVEHWDGRRSVPTTTASGLGVF
jgi:hypothetical protein